LRLKIALAVSGDFKVQIPGIGPDDLFRITVTGIVRRGFSVLGVPEIIFKLGLQGFLEGLLNQLSDAGFDFLGPGRLLLSPCACLLCALTYSTLHSLADTPPIHVEISRAKEKMTWPSECFHRRLLIGGVWQGLLQARYLTPLPSVPALKPLLQDANLKRLRPFPLESLQAYFPKLIFPPNPLSQNR